MDMTLPTLVPECVFSESEAAEHFMGYRKVASSVINDAVRDIKSWSRTRQKCGPRYRQAKESIQFLFGNDHKHIRTLWLSWLNMDDVVLQRLAAEEGITHLIKEVCDE